MLRISGILAFILFLCPEAVIAQASDWGLWTTVGIEKKLNKRWDIGFGSEYRWKEGTALTDQVRGSLDIDYKPWKFLKFGAGYVLIADKKKKKDIFVYRHRFKLDATASYKLKRITASWRLRMQATLYDKTEMDDDELDNYRWVARNRFGLKYNVPKLPLKPYAQFEVFNRMFSDITPGYYKNRISAGVEIGVGKRHELDIGYKRNSEVSDDERFNFDVISIGYKFMF